MIDFIQVSKQFGTQAVLENVSFRVNPGENVGIVGPNGAGKSTIFNLVAGEISADSGNVVLPTNVRIGHLHQQLHAHEQDGSLLNYAVNAIPELKSIEAELHHVEHQLQEGAADAEKESLLKRLGDLRHDFEELGGYDLKARAEAALSGMGFKVTDFERPFQSFSGGWQMRAELVRTLIAQPGILMLDEPSNYLDLPAVEWLQRFLREFAGTLLLISHDRYLLESLTDRTVEISGGAAVKYSGGYAYYLREREQRYRQHEAEYRNYIEQKEHLESFINRFRAKSTKASQVQSRVKMLEKLEPIRPPVSANSLSKLRIPPPPRCGAQIMSVEGISFSYDESRWIFQDVNVEIGHGEKIALVGFNGMGKTTLLRVLAGSLTPQKGELRAGHKVVIGYQSQDFAETMPPGQTLLEIVRSANPAVTESQVRELLGSFGFSGDAVNKVSRVLSGGEKIRLAFARIFINPPNFLLLDEPTTNLDIQGREALEKAVRDYKGTVCFVSHDVAFVRGAADRIISVSDRVVSSFAGGYDYYLEKAGLTHNEAVRVEKKPAAVSSSAVKKESPQETRRKRAQEREAQKELRRMETRMEELQAQQQSLSEQMASGDADLDYSALGIELSQITKKLITLEARWLEEADRLGQ